MTDPVVSRTDAPSCPFGRRRGGAPAVAALLLALVSLVACGKKGDPAPPIRQIPAAATDFEVIHRGDRLLLSAPFPTTTAAGTPLTAVTEVAFWQLPWAAPADGDAASRQMDQRQFVSGTRPGRVLAGAELKEAVVGNRVTLTVPMAEYESESAAAREGEQPMVTLAVKTQGPEGEESGFSNLVSVALFPAPEPPTGLAADGEARGIRVRWEYPETAGEEDEDGPEEEAGGDGATQDEAPEDEPESPEPEAGATDASEAERGVVGFNVYRRLATERRYGEPLRSVGRRARTFVDQTAVLGQRYVYTVTAVAERRPVLVESAFGGEVELDYRDRFAPDAPSGVVALFQQVEGENRVRVVWRPVESEDLAGYRVYRRGPESQRFAPLGEELVTGTEVIDREVVSGATYTYRVSSVDQLGNESELSEQASANIR